MSDYAAFGKIYHVTYRLRWQVTKSQSGDLEAYSDPRLEQAWVCDEDGSIDWRAVPTETLELSTD